MKKTVEPAADSNEYRDRIVEALREEIRRAMIRGGLKVRDERDISQGDKS